MRRYKLSLTKQFYLSYLKRTFGSLVCRTSSFSSNISSASSFCSLRLTNPGADKWDRPTKETLANSPLLLCALVAHPAGASSETPSTISPSPRHLSTDEQINLKLEAADSPSAALNAHQPSTVRRPAQMALPSPNPHQPPAAGGDITHQ